jgi:acetylornithine deacetylase/succinyl-diaminopimelate desuccinylase-like protein
MFTHLKAVEAYLKTVGSLPVNVMCLIEGEEEIGSPNLTRFLAANRQKLRADVFLMSDMTIPGPNRPAITYVMRAAATAYLKGFWCRSGISSVGRDDTGCEPCATNAGDSRCLDGFRIAGRSDTRAQ